jgi:hypothetical protein
MKKSISTRTWAQGLGVFILGAIVAAPLQSQGWRQPTGSAQAASVTSGGVTSASASATLPSGGGVEKADEGSVSVAGLLTTGGATAVTSGSSSPERLGVQGVATAANVNILNGRITAARVIAISTATDERNRVTLDGEGTGSTGLVIDGVAYGESVAPNTRVDLPGAGYVVLNEQVRGKGRGASLTVRAIHVYLTGGGEVIVASVTSGNGS